MTTTTKSVERFINFTNAVSFVAKKLNVSRQEATHFVWDHQLKVGTDRAIWLII